MTEQNTIALTEEECLVCERVKIAQYYRECREVGFTRQFALKILKVLAQIYFKDHTFFAGRARGPIKGGVAYSVYTYGYGSHDSLEVLKIKSERGISRLKAHMLLGFRSGILEEKIVGRAITVHNKSIGDSVKALRVSSFNQVLLAWKFDITVESLRSMYHSIYLHHQDILAAVCGARSS